MDPKTSNPETKDIITPFQKKKKKEKIKPLKKKKKKKSAADCPPIKLTFQKTTTKKNEEIEF